jgi:hypothetical protein
MNKNNIDITLNIPAEVILKKGGREGTNVIYLKA